MKNEWISIKAKQKPKNQNMVIVSDGKKTWGAYYTPKYKRWEMTYSLWWYGNVPFAVEDITHWMYQPEPPKS